MFFFVSVVSQRNEHEMAKRGPWRRRVTRQSRPNRFEAAALRLKALFHNRGVVRQHHGGCAVISAMLTNSMVILGECLEAVISLEMLISLGITYPGNYRPTKLSEKEK